MNKEINKILIAGTEYDIRDSRFDEASEAETSRQESEQGRVTAEQQRADAEAARAEEFATFEGKIDAKEDVANKVTSINADADDVHYPSAKAVWSAIKNNIGNTEGGNTEGVNTEKIDSIYNQLTYTYTYGNTDVTTTVQRAQKCWIFNEALNSTRTISSVIISTDYNGEAQIVIVDSSTNSVLRTHTIILNGQETDVSSYNIKVNAGERFGLACSTSIIGFYSSTTDRKAGYLGKYPIIVGDSIGPSNYSVDVAFTFTDYIDIKELYSRLKDVGYDKQEYTDFPLNGYYRNDTGEFVALSGFLASELIEISQPTIVEFDTAVSVNNQSFISPVIKFNANKAITGIVDNGELITEKSYVAYSCYKVAKSFCLKKFSPVWNGGDSNSVTVPLNDYLVDGVYLTSTNNEYSYKGFCKSVYIKVYEGDVVINTYKSYAASQILVYDEQKNFIKSASSPYTVESNGFVRISFAWKDYSSTFAPDTYSEIKILRSKENDEIERNKQFNTLNAIPYNELTHVPETTEIASSASNAFINLKNIEYKKADIDTTIENIGRAYLYKNEDTGNLELRIVKDISTIVGCELSVKKTVQKSIVSKSFSMIHFGDSVTEGAGSDEGKHYIDVIKNSLISYGHTITNQVNKGIGGEYCESYYYKVLNYDKEHFDIATLMIGFNDRERWFTSKGGTYEQFAEFRKWYRKYLRLLISAIFSYCTPKRLYLITPYYYKYRLFTDITTDECIYAARDIENVHLCRGDIYIQNGELGGLHINNDGALLLGTEIAKEMAPDISTISDL